MVDEQKEAITFEVIRDIQLREKNEPKLIKLPDGFYEKVKAYLALKFKLARESDNPKFLLEAKSVKRMIEDIFYQRERKIISHAFVYIKTGLIPENLTEEEFEFFKSIVNLIKERRTKYIESIEKLNEEELLEEAKKISDVIAAEETETKTGINNQKEETSKAIEEVPEEKIKEAIEKKVKEEPKQEDKKKVMILMDLPNFLGIDGKEYGPYKEGDMVELPIEIADLLIRKKAAEEYLE
ncbi:MAG: DNA replication complex GINS family protein [Candidatus Aenigmarchaeota archaeon]|nr:DNA replication complex GINS family protein [Candidatus Aenigmarchaeota archaeon]